MRKRLILFISLFLFWMAFFTVARAIFLAYNYPFTAQLNFIEVLKSFLYGLKMDMSMTGYFMVIYGLILAASTFFTSHSLFFSTHAVTILFLSISSLIVMVDLELYRHWGFRMNTTPFFYMGSEAAGSVGLWIVIRMFVIAGILFASFCWAYFRFISPYFN